MSRFARHVSNVPLGSQYEPASPVRRPAPTDKSRIATRDAIGEKVVGKPKAYGTVAPKRRVAPCDATNDNMSAVMGKSASASGSSPTTMTANRAMQLAMRSGGVGASASSTTTAPPAAAAAGVRNRAVPTNQIGSNAVLAGGAPTMAASSSTTTAPTATAAASTAKVPPPPQQRPVTPQRHCGNPTYRDPNDLRFRGAAGAPSQQPARPHIRVAGKNTAMEGAAGVKSEDRVVRDQRFTKRVQPAGATGMASASYGNVFAGSSEDPTINTTANGGEFHVGKRLVPGRSTISPFRGVSPQRQGDGLGASSNTRGNISPYRLYATSKPFATDDDVGTTANRGGSAMRPAISPQLGGKRRSAANLLHHDSSNTATTAATTSAPSGTLAGVFKADPTVNKRPTRAVSPQAPWESQQSSGAAVGGKARVMGPTSVAARRDHMSAVLTTTGTSSSSPRGAAVGSSNIMGRTSPFRPNASYTNTPTMPIAGKASDAAETAALRKTAMSAGVTGKVGSGMGNMSQSTTVSNGVSGSSAAAPSPSSPAVAGMASRRTNDTRPVWKQTPRVERPRSSIACRTQQRAAAPAPWATD